MGRSFLNRVVIVYTLICTLEIVHLNVIFTEAGNTEAGNMKRHMRTHTHVGNVLNLLEIETLMNFLVPQTLPVMSIVKLEKVSLYRVKGPQDT